jgi:hypothetical protein
METNSQRADKRKKLLLEINKTISFLDTLNDDRLEIISRYCSHCGSSDKNCFCSNDE